MNNLVRKPDAGNPHVRFDERGGETDARAHRASPRLYCETNRAHHPRRCLILRPLLFHTELTKPTEAGDMRAMAAFMVILEQTAAASKDGRGPVVG